MEIDATLFLVLIPLFAALALALVLVLRTKRSYETLQSSVESVERAVSRLSDRREPAGVGGVAEAERRVPSPDIEDPARRRDPLLAHVSAEQPATATPSQAPRPEAPLIEPRQLTRVAQYLQMLVGLAGSEAGEIRAFRDEIVESLRESGWTQMTASADAIPGWHHGGSADTLQPMRKPSAAKPKGDVKVGRSLSDFVPARQRAPSVPARVPDEWAEMWGYLWACHLDYRWGLSEEPAKRWEFIKASVRFRENLARERNLWEQADARPRVVSCGYAESAEGDELRLPGLRSKDGWHVLDPVVFKRSPRPRFLVWWRDIGESAVGAIAGQEEVGVTQHSVQELNEAVLHSRDVNEPLRRVAEALLGVRERELHRRLDSGTLMQADIERTEPLIEQAGKILEDLGYSIPLEDDPSPDAITVDEARWPVPREFVARVPKRVWLSPPVLTADRRPVYEEAVVLVRHVVTAPFESLANQALWWQSGRLSDASRALVEEARDYDRAMGSLGPDELLDDDIRARISTEFWPRLHGVCFATVGDADTPKPLREEWLRSVNAAFERVGFEVRDVGEAPPEMFDAPESGEQPRPALIDVESQQAVCRGKESVVR